MIPVKLSLNNFLSYRQANLDFNGLHTACICGQNGAGKSSLLEAITWVIWGKTRAGTEDDVIHIGEKDVRVDFELISNYQHYKIIRTRSRGKSSSLDFQIKSDNNKFISLSGKGVRNTQEQIINELKLDYETFINSAYLRQGKADEFMTKTAAERKKVLAELLNLEHYQKLSEKAKDQSKQIKGKYEELEAKLDSETQELADEIELLDRQKTIEIDISEAQKQEDIDRKTEQKLRESQVLRESQEKQIDWEKQKLLEIEKESNRFQQEAVKLQEKLTNIEQLLAQETDINTKYQELLNFREEREKLDQNFKEFQQLQTQKRELEKQLDREINKLKFQLQTAKNNLINLEQKEEENQDILKSKNEVKKALIILQEKQQYLEQLDQLQTQIEPLTRQSQNLETEINKIKNKLSLKLEDLQTKQDNIEVKIGKIPEQKEKLSSLDQQLNVLDNKKNYLKRLEDKSLTKEKLIFKLNEQENKCQELIQELEQKLQLLQKPDSVCPLCERELDETHRHYVINKTIKQQEDNREHIWTIKEQINSCKRELEKLSQEKLGLNRELQEYESIYQQFLQIENQLEQTLELGTILTDIKEEIEQLESALHTDNYATDLQKELTQIKQDLTRLNYSPETHALVRKEVKNLHWAEIKQSKIDDANRQLIKIAAQKPEIINNINTIEQQLKEIEINSEIQQEINQINVSLEELNYSADHHNQILDQIKTIQNYDLMYRKLTEEKQEYPNLKKRQEELQNLLQEKEKEVTEIKEKLKILLAELEIMKDNSNDLKILAEKMQNRRQELNDLLAEKGKIEQSLKQIREQKIKNKVEYERLKELKKQYRVYEELSLAFGKNGIQALMIENILPQLEAESNNILSRLTGNQFHVQFLTQKSSKSTSKKKTKLIDTLDILIADTKGTRTYETYSGGEAFRINFSIRLALAKLLAQRAGTSLQMLIIDEGFGTQDGEGCDRLIAAINAISSDFNCILAVTHIPQFKEAFQTRIEIEKTQEGSQIKLSI